MRTRKTYRLSWSNHTLELGRQTCIMGVVNVTPDSFSDGGKFFASDAAVAQGEKLAAQGAAILDIGGESTRPFSDPVPIDEEIRRIVPVIEKLSQRISIPISIDTTKAQVARRALWAGASIISVFASGGTSTTAPAPGGPCGELDGMMSFSVMSLPSMETLPPPRQENHLYSGLIA